MASQSLLLGRDLGPVVDPVRPSGQIADGVRRPRVGRSRSSHCWRVFTSGTMAWWDAPAKPASWRSYGVSCRNYGGNGKTRLDTNKRPDSEHTGGAQAGLESTML